MPPIPFHPTHQTPFKSTVSTSQQSRVHHTPFEAPAEASTQISISDIDPFQWKYHAEGGKNLLLSFNPSEPVQTGGSPFSTPNCTYALRIPKSLPSDSQDQEPQEQEDEAERFTQSIIVPLLGSASVLPKCIKIPIVTARDRDVIETLAARIEMQRPASRRAHPARIRPEWLSCIYAVQDVTVPTAASPSVLCVEIKPKWGFLPRIQSLPPASPNVDIKTKYSRYRMHRVLKHPHPQALTRQQFESLYDPLDLYSAEDQRREKAIRALWTDWCESDAHTNNFRLFWNGTRVHPHDRPTLNAIARFLGADGQTADDNHEEDALLQALIQHLTVELSKPSLPSIRTLNQAAGTGDREDEDAGVSVLSRLSQLQSSLDPLDVEGLAHLWLHHTQSHILGKLPPTLPNTQFQPTPEPSPPTSTPEVAELSVVLERFLLNTTGASDVDVELQDAVQAFLVSASFKDCSLLIRFSPSPSSPSDSHSQAETGSKIVVGNQRLQSETKLVDLDRKAMAKLEAMQQTDNEVCAAFLAWLSSLDEAHPPAPSLPP